eukprot:719107-Pleurochrysis_carterae.AAC.1
MIGQLRFHSSRKCALRPAGSGWLGHICVVDLDVDDACLLIFNVRTSLARGALARHLHYDMLRVIPKALCVVAQVLVKVPRHFVSEEEPGDLIGDAELETIVPREVAAERHNLRCKPN